jgi:hypothetical protein
VRPASTASCESTSPALGPRRATWLGLGLG